MLTTELYYGNIDEQRSLLYLDDFILDPLDCIGRETIRKIEIIDCTGQAFLVPKAAFNDPLYKIISDQLIETFEFEKIIVNDSIIFEMNWWDDLLIEADDAFLQTLLATIDQTQSFPISDLTSYCKNNPLLYQRFENGICILQKPMSTQAFKTFIVDVEHYAFKTQNLLEDDAD